MIRRSSMIDYAYAKTSGKFAKAFVAERANRLFAVKSLSELWQLVLQTEVPAVPEAVLAQMLEKQAEKRFIGEFCALMRSFSEPNPVALQLLRSYDYSNLKKINFALRTGSNQLPELTDIGGFGVLNYGAWPNCAKMTRGTPFSWYTKPVDSRGITQFEHDLDCQYTRELWEAAKQFTGEERDALISLIGEEIVLTNCIWAIRLRLYYDMSGEDVKKHLVWESKIGCVTDCLASSALKVLSFPLDSYEAWAKWQYAPLLNPHEEGNFWTVDPRYLTRAANARINRQALRLFHKFPCSPAFIVPWFKIKQYELDCIRTAVEALRLNVDTEQAKALVGLGANG